MYDLIYVGHDEYEEYEELKEKFQKRFPAATIADASDDIHGWRFSIEMEDVKKREYLKYVIREGIVNLSFNMQMMMHTKELIGEVQEILDEMLADTDKEANDKDLLG